MSALAVRTGSLNLGQGYPDEDGPPGMLDVATAAIRGGRNQYAPGPGVPELRQAIADHQARCYDLELDPDSQVLVTAGATEAVTAAVLALVDPGDEVVLVEPFYDSYPAAVEMAGGVRRTVAMRRTEAGFRLDVDQLHAVVSDRTRVLVLNTPHNPTGAVLDRQELAAVATVAEQHDVVVVVDEVYEHLTYDGHGHVPLATLPGMAERTVSVSSAGKTFSCTGWKVGWVTGSPELVRTVMAAKQWLTFTNAAPLQPAVAHALDHEAAYVEALAARLAAGRDLLCAGLADLGLDPVVPHGTYFTLGDVSRLGWDDAMAFCLALPERAGVVAVPAGPFHDPGGDAYGEGRRLVRWAFCKDRAVVEEALARLAAADLSPA
ncbi:MAG: Glutamine-dependent 2-keto-4-methylthiobutyrate transaminase [uncultured Nocardioidaceae bacterium]|uniref:Glutamine-dependent 2-keto-4-methylthiobutyrate transaminase n=1 Tax=uncultured Nocardioidaceae bacterium TaxID=253824 RepID=A0A6J4M2G0_9ACTN|nr:MAG: Glutamine-dependent 2-keto-4-methylthiobutyrate transaminase [uncultured Nocardioidaceae bacterium]